MGCVRETGEARPPLRNCGWLGGGGLWPIAPAGTSTSSFWGAASGNRQSQPARAPFGAGKHDSSSFCLQAPAAWSKGGIAGEAVC